MEMEVARYVKVLEIILIPFLQNHVKDVMEVVAAPYAKDLEKIKKRWKI